MRNNQPQNYSDLNKTLYMDLIVSHITESQKIKVEMIC